ncbi:hypothetical protein JVU11DRAFT_7920 [Chiua virens]|nr:hypothetical protein JVU11DRAFT_7920 [Chiua virens]
MWLVKMSDVKVYIVNGAVAGSSSSIPDWLTKTRTTKAKGKRALREHVEGQIELIQGFEFPEASNKIKTTRDGHHAIATGTVTATPKTSISLSSPTTGPRRSTSKTDRTLELHTQSGFHYRTRIPRFGRSLAYHYPSCDALVAGAGHEVYRLNLEQGRFLNPLVLRDGDGDAIAGVNCIDVNPAHQLLAFGLDGRAGVQFWDLRSRAVVGVLDLPQGRLVKTGRTRVTLPGVDESTVDGLGVTAIAARSDGLSYAIGTTTGHTLLYDVRSPRPFAFKDQGYGLPLKRVAWLEGGSRMAGDGMVLSADKKVVKIWDRNTPSSNFVSITPTTDLNDIHHIPGSGLLLTANEGIKMASYYIPQLGPAPRWASFLENITEEMEDTSVRNVYEDYKFIERNELRTLGLDHLVGTPALKPYMHGYFVSLNLYDTARVIANPFSYAEHRERLVKERLEKLADTRIRTRKGGATSSVKVNKALAEKIARDAERARRREEKRKARKATKAAEGSNADAENEAMSVEHEPAGEGLTLLNDARFKELFANPDFAVDETSREYALLNPSSVAQKNANSSRGKTAVEEADESDRMSSDGLGSSGDESSEDDSESDDSSDAGALNRHDLRFRAEQKNARLQQVDSRTRDASRQSSKVHFVPLDARTSGLAGRTKDKEASFGQRLARPSAKSSATVPSKVRFSADGGMEMTFIPSGAGEDTPELATQKKKMQVRRGVEVFGSGMERGVEEPKTEMSESERSGRKQRRKGMRSGSKNVFRRMTTQSQYAAAARVPLIKSPAVRVPPPVELPPDIHPLPDSVTPYFAYPFVLEPHILTLESARRNTLAAYTARRQNLLQMREDDNERRKREALRRVAPGFDGGGTPLEPVRQTQMGVSSTTAGDKRPQEDVDVMESLVEELEKMVTTTSAVTKTS